MITVPALPPLAPEGALSDEPKTTDAGEVATGPVIAIGPPPPALRADVARLIVEILARQALADLGLVARNDNREPPK